MRPGAVCIWTYISALIFVVFGLEASFKTRKVCDQNYGGVFEAITGAGEKMSIWCASLCTTQSNCASSIYDPTTKVCRLNNHRLAASTQSSSCDSHVTYIEKQLCMEGNRCTYPVQNTRLCNGTRHGQCHESKGRLEVFVSGQWGTVCDDYWNDTHHPTSYPNAIVTCRMYGYSNGSRNMEAHFGEGFGNISRDDVKCIGNEESILDCPYLTDNNHNCEHWEDVGVTCF